MLIRRRRLSVAIEHRTLRIQSAPGNGGDPTEAVMPAMTPALVEPSSAALDLKKTFENFGKEKNQ